MPDNKIPADKHIEHQRTDSDTETDPLARQHPTAEEPKSSGESERPPGQPTDGR
jgi:hypothetical protein